MRVAINLASRPFADLAPSLRNLRIAIAALFVVALALGFALHAVHDKADAARARVHSLDGQIAQVRQEQQRYQAMMQQPDNARTLQQSENLNRLFDEKGFSWTLAMEDLETVLPAGVQVQTLEPAVKDGQITVHIRVLGPRDRDVQFVQNLERSRHFVLPRIVGESAESTGGPNQRPEPVSASSRVGFDILADYTPGSPEERRQIKRRSEAAKSHDRSGEPQGNAAGSQPQRSAHTGIARPKAPVQPYRGVPR